MPGLDAKAARSNRIACGVLFTAVGSLDLITHLTFFNWTRSILRLAV